MSILIKFTPEEIAAAPPLDPALESLLRSVDLFEKNHIRIQGAANQRPKALYCDGRHCELTG